MILQSQTKWRWIIAVYLFLAGLGAGAYLTGVVAEYLGPGWMSLSRIGVALGFPCVLVGSMFLIFVDDYSTCSFMHHMHHDIAPYVMTATKVNQ